MKRSIINADRNVALGIAQYIAPMDSGNLRYNAIRSEPTNDGFRITYSLSDAYYIYFLEEGTRKFIGHKGFIGGQTVPAIAGYFYSKYQIKNTNRTNDFIFYSKKGKGEIAGMTIIADIRNQNSLNQDIKAMATQNNWYSETIFENYEDFKDKNINDYVEVMNEKSR